MKVRLDALQVNAIRRARNLTYENICEQSLGVFQVFHLKYLLNGKTQLISEEKAVLLAGILGVRLEAILANDFMRWATVPADINITVKRLFIENKEEITPRYLELLRERIGQAGFQNLRSQVLRLREIFTRPALDDEHAQKVLLALDCIRTKFAPNQELFSSWIGVDHSQFSWFLGSLDALEPEFSVKHMVLLFVYILIIFESIFLEVLVASAIQRSPDRWRDVTEQYYVISIPFERLKNAYLDFLLNEQEALSHRSQLPLEVGDAYYSDGLLLVMSAAAAASHLDGDLIGSQHVSRKTLHSIQTRIIRTASDVFDLRISFEEPRDRYFSRFGSRYQTFRLIRQATLGCENHRESGTSLTSNEMLVAMWIMKQC